jgi:hypothetical protein
MQQRRQKNEDGRTNSEKRIATRRTPTIRAKRSIDCSPILWNRFNTMKTIQVVLDGPLLRAADRAAKWLKVNRSALFRAALRAHLAALSTGERKRADRAGYERSPDRDGGAWDKVAAWPED